jgi:ribosomal protein L34E
MKNYRGTLLFLAGFVGVLSAGWFGFPRAAYERQNQPVQFSHKAHREKADMKCEDCHAILGDGAFSGIPGIAKCAECHAAPLGTTKEEERMIKQYIEPQREIPWLVYARQPQNVRFSHATHSKLAKLTCERCHQAHGASDSLRPLERDRVSGYSRDLSSDAELPVRKRAGLDMDDCMRCHDQRGVEDSCLACHK